MAALDDGIVHIQTGFSIYYHNSGNAGGEWRPFTDEQCRIIDQVFVTVGGKVTVPLWLSVLRVACCVLRVDGEGEGGP